MLEEPRVFFGDRVEERLPRLLDELAVRRLVLVADAVAFRASGAESRLGPALEGREIAQCSDFGANPKLSELKAALSQIEGWDFDGVVALGGGSAIDLAKLIRAVTVNQLDAKSLILGNAGVDRAGPPLIAVPTTAGTGSEATHFAVAYVNDEKYSVASSNLLPEFAIIDPHLTSSLAPQITAATGLDAFCQGLESCWAVGASAQSMAYAEQAIRLSLQHLERSVRDPDGESRRGMCQAAHLSGRAINISKTTASHALSYAITTRFGAPHGMAVAVTLPAVLRFNGAVGDGDCNDPRGATQVMARMQRLFDVLGVVDTDQAADCCARLITACGGALRLRDLGVTEDAVLWLAQQVNQERLSNNPRAMPPEAAYALLRETY